MTGSHEGCVPPHMPDHQGDVGDDHGGVGRNVWGMVMAQEIT